MEPIKAVSPTESGTDKSGESYRKWKQSKVALCAALIFALKRLEDRRGTKTTAFISYRHEVHTDVDFMKIMDGEKLIGVLNFNNMIPVDESCTIPLNLRIVGKDDAATKKYKKMAAKQLDWCQHNQEAIVKRANKLYVMQQSEKTSAFLKRRCCDFRKLETVLQKWKGSRNS